MAITKTYFDTYASAASAANEDVIVIQQIQQGAESDLSQMKQATVGLIRQPLNDRIDGINLTQTGTTGSFIEKISQSSGTVSAVVTPFASAADIAAGAKVAPRADAVRDYVQNEIDTTVASKISSAVANLDADTTGEDGKYIKTISEESGIINPTAQSFDLKVDSSSAHNNAPTSKAVYEHVKERIENLDGEVGGENYLVKKVKETDGVITGVAVALDNDLSSNASGVPTSQAIKNLVANLSSSVGNSNTLIKSITETSGVISAETVEIANQIDTLNPNRIPNSQAVYDFNQAAVYNALGALDFPNASNPNQYFGENGYYLKTIKQTDGKLDVTKQKFDEYSSSSSMAGSWSPSPSNNNAPTSQAVDTLVNVTKNVINKRIDDLNFPEEGGEFGSSGYFLRTIKQEKGEISASQVAFENSKTNITSNTENSYSALSVSSSTTYSSNADTAPTVKATAEQIKRLDQRLDATYNEVKNLSWSSTPASTGKFIGGVSQTTGLLRASYTDFLNAVPDSSSASGAIAPSANAVRNAINALKASSVGAAGSYIKLIEENTGVITATPEAFDTYENRAWVTGPTNDNAPTSQAVENRIAEAKRQILEETESMSYLGAVTSTTGMASKASAAKSSGAALYDVGDTFIAKKEFNLAENIIPQPPKEYKVLPGDLVIVNTKCNSIILETLNNFDIIDSSDNSITYASEAAATVGNFLAFSDASGKTVFDSGENADTIAARVSQSASYAKEASLSASYASSSANYIDTQSGPIIASASEAASYAENYKNAASTSASYAENYKGSAEGSKNAASVAASYAEAYKNAASTSASYAEVYKGNALGSKNAASVAASYAEVYKGSAESSKNAASTSASYAEVYKGNALGSKNAASNYADEALGFRDDAEQSKINAAKFADEANLEGIKNAASTSASYAASSASTASKKADAASASASYASSSATIASEAASYASNFAKINNLSSIRDAASVAASYAEVYKGNALDSKNAASVAASYAEDYKGDAEDYKNAASTSASYAEDYEGSAEGFKNAASTSASYAASYTKSANLEGIKNAASTSASYASSSANVAQQAADSAMPKAGGTFTGTVCFGNESKSINTLGNATLGTVSATSFTATSSRKVKENIKPTIISALDVIDKVSIVDFNYITDDEKTPHIGFIAEDTPSILSTPHLNGMDYTNCIGTLFKAIQEITEGIANLKKEIDEIK